MCIPVHECARVHIGCTSEEFVMAVPRIRQTRRLRVLNHAPRYAEFSIVSKHVRMVPALRHNHRVERDA